MSKPLLFRIVIGSKVRFLNETGEGIVGDLVRALAAETAGLDYYASVLDTASDPEIIAFAREFVDEEAGHVAELKRWIAARKAGEVVTLQI